MISGDIQLKLFDRNICLNDKRFLSMICSLFLCSLVNAEQAQTLHSPYAGEESRKIKTLSDDDIAQLQQGKGWGLAKAAELNGVPGPIHLLEMQNEISLNPQQIENIRRLFDSMKAKAIPLGLKLIEQENELNQAFAKGSINETSLRDLIVSIEATRAELRFVHLVAHLKTPNILTPAQIQHYNQIRGYDSSDPCRSVPAGHNAEMWKKHNGCL